VGRAPPAAFGGKASAFRTMSLTLSAVPRTSMPDEKYTTLGFQARSLACSSATDGERSTATCIGRSVYLSSARQELNGPPAVLSRWGGVRREHCHAGVG